MKNLPRVSRSPAAAAWTLAALAALAPSAQARNVRLMESVPEAVRTARVHEILGDLALQFGSDSARGAAIVRRDVVVKGVGSTRIADVGDDDKVRPSDHDLCARAFEDAVTQLAFAARGAKAAAIVGVISNYEGATFDDPTHYECHAGALKAAVTLRGQLARRATAPDALPGTPAPAPAAPADTAPPAPPAPPAPSAPPAADLVPPPPPPTFQPLPPASGPAGR